MKLALLDDRTRTLVAVACIAVSVAVLVMAAIGWYHDNKVRTIREAHRAEMSSMRRDYFILWSQVLLLTQGATELRVYTGATGTGTWTDLSPVGVNRMASRPQPYYAAQARLATGGNFTGGTEVDLIKIRTSAQNATASNIDESASERGLPAGTYFLRLQTLTGGVVVNDAAQLIYSLLWEERP